VRVRAWTFRALPSSVVLDVHANDQHEHGVEDVGEFQLGERPEWLTGTCLTDVEDTTGLPVPCDHILVIASEPKLRSTLRPTNGSTASGSLMARSLLTFS
jgi:hypothetical protein